MGAASPVKTAPRIPPLLTWCWWCQRSHYDCFLMFILQKHLCLCLIWSVALYSHVFLHQTCLFLYSALQLRDTKLPKTTPGKKTTTFCHFHSPHFFSSSSSSSFAPSTARHVLLLPAFPSSVLSHTSSSPLTPAEKWSHPSYASASKFSRMWSDFSVEVARRVSGCGGDDFLLVSTWAGYLCCYVTVGNWLFSECTTRGEKKTTLTRVGLFEAFWWISNERNQCGKRIPLVVLRAFLYFYNTQGTDLRSSAGQHSLLRSW